MIFIPNHVYLIKDTLDEFVQLDITGEEYRIMAVPDDCRQPCHVSKDDIRNLLEPRDCRVCAVQMCERRMRLEDKHPEYFKNDAGKGNEGSDSVGKKERKKIASFLLNIFHSGPG